MNHSFEEFRARREAGNARVLDTDNLAIKRFFALDKQVYADGALDVRTKELMGLVASLVLRCNDFIDYHLERCVEEGCGRDELDEADDGSAGETIESRERAREQERGD